MIKKIKFKYLVLILTFILVGVYTVQIIITEDSDQNYRLEGSNLMKCDQELTPIPENTTHFEKKNEPIMDDFNSNGESVSVNDFYEKTKTGGLIVIQEGDLKYEFYKDPYSQNKTVRAQSATRSIVSLLTGITLDKELIKLDSYVADHLPELEGSFYEEVTVLDLLQRSSGVQLKEECGNLFTTIPSLKESKILNECFLNVQQNRPPGNLVDAIESEAGVLLGYVLTRAVDDNLTSFVEDNLWSHIGAEHESCWYFNSEGEEIPFSFFHATLRDYAKIGQLILQKGNMGGKEVISSEWVDRMISPVEMKQINNENYDYGFHWLLPKDRKNKEIISIIGGEGFYIYLDFSEEVVIVKTGEDPNYRENRDLHLSFFRAAVKHFSK